MSASAAIAVHPAGDFGAVGNVLPSDSGRTGRSIAARGMEMDWLLGAAGIAKGSLRATFSFQDR
ncbi:hypothetical protein [Rubripirellula lacrimiformis]|uniref:hypothetical protein n=1 Tax=Rubripirellula lacrimiformis TaxID=1930273 RepID=UPI0011A21F4D|nr:hypothetical protein [Rubripirellula lacrimiformis]